ncbi:MAG: hypothetical protein AB4290_04455 [Spirulina sp.]
MANASGSDRLDRIEANLEQLTTVVVNLAQSNQELQGTVGNLSQEVESVSREVGSLSQEVRSLARENQKLQTMVANLTQSNQQLSNQTQELTKTVTYLMQIVELHQANHEASQRNFDIIVKEMTGLRTESLRILEHLFGEQQE